MNLLINGLITGAVFAIAASGLVVTYSTSGVFNFAHGALGMLCAYVYWDVRVNKAWPAPVALAFVLLLFAIALRVLLYRTRVGVSMRAVVDDRHLLELNGGRPDRASLVSWMVGVGLSALAGILITPFEGGSLSSTLLTLLVINAFAAAMFGRLRSLPLTFAGAVVLGLATRVAFERPTGLMPKSFDWGGNLGLAG